MKFLIILVIILGGVFYFSTSNTDGRGNVHPGDDKIIRMNPTILTSVD